MRLRTAKNQNVLGGTLKLISAHCVSFLQRRRGKRIKYIPFTQYLLPNGRKIETGIFRPDEIYEKAMDIIDAGFRFEAEILRTGEVSITITDNDDVDVDIEVVENGPDVLLAVDQLVNRFHEILEKRGDGDARKVDDRAKREGCRE